MFQTVYDEIRAIDPSKLTVCVCIQIFDMFIIDNEDFTAHHEISLDYIKQIIQQTIGDIVSQSIIHISYYSNNTIRSFLSLHC